MSDTQLAWTLGSGHTNEYYRASGREGREYMVVRVDDLESFEEGDLAWAAGAVVTVPGDDGRRRYRDLRRPRQEHSLPSAQRLCQAWEDAFEMADELLLDGNIELAQRLRDEPDD